MLTNRFNIYNRHHNNTYYNKNKFNNEKNIKRTNRFRFPWVYVLDQEEYIYEYIRFL